MKTTLFLITFIFSLSSFAGVLEIIKIGHPTLRATAAEVTQAEIESPEFQKLIDDMITTMGKAGGVGIAAPQVNKSVRMFVMKSWPNVPLTVVINPRVEYLESYGKASSTEGCLSIPGKNLKIERFKRLHLSYFNRKGEYITEEVKGFKAVITQHEYDHLNGVLIVDLIQEILSTFDLEKYVNVPLM